MNAMLTLGIRSFRSSVVGQLLHQSRLSTRTWKAQLMTKSGMGKVWTQQEDNLLLLRRKQGATFKTIATELSRTENSVRSQYHSKLARLDPVAREKLSTEDKSKLEIIERRTNEGKLFWQIAEELGIETRQARYIYRKFHPGHASDVWSEKEIRDVLRFAHDGLDSRAMSTALDRTTGAIRSMLYLLRNGKVPLPTGVTSVRPARRLVRNSSEEKKRTPLSRWSQTRLNRLVSLHEGGVPVMQLATEFGVSRDAIYAVLRNRSGSPNPPPRIGGWTAKEYGRLRQLYEVEKVPWEEIAPRMSTEHQKRSQLAVQAAWRRLCKNEKLANSMSKADNISFGGKPAAADIEAAHDCGKRKVNP